MFIQTTALKKILNLKKRLKIIQGGSSAGKTIANLLILIDKAQSRKDLIISVVSETLPHLRRGAIRDFLQIMESHGYYKDASWNKSEFTYLFETGSKIEFFSADQPGKVRGPRRDILFLNEANNIGYEVYTQLAIRTNEEIYLDFNPVSEFWVNTDVIGKADCDFLILTYKDNEGLSPNIIQEIESRKERKDWFQVYGEGLLGEIEGRIYKDWKIIDEIPHEAKLERYGLDFGYTDPTAIVAIYSYNGGYVLDEITFTSGLNNKQIADIFLNKDKALVAADSAEPKSVDEISGYRVNIMNVKKGKDSVRQGIQFVQAQRISVTKKSVNVIKEYRNYLWMVDNNGRILGEPEHQFSHSMDAIRYGFISLVGVHPRKQFIQAPYVSQEPEIEGSQVPREESIFDVFLKEEKVGNRPPFRQKEWQDNY